MFLSGSYKHWLHLWFGGQDRSEASLDLFYEWLGGAKNKRVGLAVMDMWKAFRNSTPARRTLQGSQKSVLYLNAGILTSYLSREEPDIPDISEDPNQTEGNIRKAA